MKKDILLKFLEKESINSGFLEIFYTFASGEGDIVWNDLHTKSEHYCGDKLLANKFPGLSIGYTDTPSNPIAGSGYFTRNDMLRVGSGIGYDDWAIFMDFGDELCAQNKQIANVPEVLVSSMDSPSSISGFNLCINNSNKLFFEYNSSDGKIIHTLDQELANFNVVSLSYSNFNNEIDLSYHDFPNGQNKNKAFKVEGYKHGDVWYLGGMHNPSAQYTGYSGHIDDFLFFIYSLYSKILFQ